MRITYRQVRRYLGELTQAQYSRKTINRRLSAIKGLFRWMNLTGVIDSDPVSVIQGPKSAKGLPRMIPASDMGRILTVYKDSDDPADMRNQAILEFLYACGARISEASGLMLADVEFDAKQVKVFGKGSKERIIPLHDMAVKTMKSYAWRARPVLLKGKPNEFFFVSTRGNRMGPDAMRKMFKNTLIMAGVDTSYTPHDMRHTFATDLVEGGADLKSVQEMLGHESLSTTQIYTHLSVDHLKQAVHQAHPRG
jgi:integrase/recombinase XerD